MEKASRLKREIWAVVFFALAILVAASLLSHDPWDRSLSTPSGSVPTRNWGGEVGSYLSDFLLQALGLASYLLPAFLLAASYALLRGAYYSIRWTRFLGGAFLLWSGAILLSLLSKAETARESGGILGDLSKAFLLSIFGGVGAHVIVLSALVLSVLLLTECSLEALLERGKKELPKLERRFSAALGNLKSSWRRRVERRIENPKKERRHFVPPPIVLKEEVREEGPQKPKKKPPEQLELPALGPGYTLPAPFLLDSPEGDRIRIDKETLEANSLILQKKLSDFEVDGEVVAVRPGPVITMYEFKPAAGVKVRRIVTLADDLSMALRAVSVRILAPIPGEEVVGIEIPNPRREKVHLREVIESEAYQSAESKLTLALGKDTSGAPFVTDLARMPHLLVAGATGTGKSVSINAMILSILFRASPQDAQFIMIDPKMLELTVYEDLPHLLVPVVTDAKKAAAALFWAMDEMDRRYRLMRDKGARNIDHYNHILKRQDKSAADHGEAQEPAFSRDAEEPLVHEPLPRIVIVIDELADLMMTVGRDIEEYITRLAQKARAAGIHMILATQRPSVDVITGLIKANFPARISFQVTSRVDSRTILDAIGAERLLGDGDMLFLPPGTARLVRIHGAYVSDQEIRKVVEFVKQQAKPRYRLEVFEARKHLEGAEWNDEDYDEMYDQAVAIVTETQQASISMIQRRLRVGYNRAARMIEQMEREGIVGPAEGGKPREVYARKTDA